MKKIHPSLLAFLLAAGLTLVSFTSLQTNLTGTWNMAVITSQGSGNPTLVLKQEKDTIITGTYTGLFGELPLKGTLKGDKIDLVIKSTDVTMEYIGTVNGNSMTGKVVYTGLGEGTFTGKKKE